MKRKKRQIERFVRNLVDYQEIPREKDLRLLYKFAENKDSDIRGDVAALLQWDYSEKGERVLLRLSRDIEPLVQIEAVESLSDRKSAAVLYRLYELHNARDYLVRGYAITAYFDVWLNRMGYTRKNLEIYVKRIKEKMDKEENSWVKIQYLRNMYICGQEDALRRMEKIMLESMRLGDYQVMFIGINTLDALMVKKNRHEIIDILQRMYPEMIETQREDMHAVLEREVKQRVLFVDDQNTYLSQLLEAAGDVLAYQDAEFYSAGVCPGEKLDSKVAVLLERWYQMEDVEEERCPKSVDRAWRMDKVFVLSKNIPLEMFGLNDAEYIHLDLERGTENLKVQIEEVIKEYQPFQ